MSGYSLSSRDNVADYDDYIVSKQHSIVEKCEDILSNAQNEDRELAANEAQEIARLEAQFEALKVQSELAIKVNSMRNAFPSKGRKTSFDDLNGSSSLKSWGYGGSYNLQSKFKQLFPSANGDMGGFKDGHDWFKAVFGAMTGHFDPRLTNAGSNTGEGSTGGFFLPIPIAGGLFDATIAASVFLPRARVVPVISKQTVFPRFLATDRSVGLLNGFHGEWLGEGSTGTLQTASVGALTVTTNKLAIFTKATAELVTDAPLFVTEFEPALAAAAAYRLDNALMRGTGVGQPLGILNDSATVTVAAEGGQAADTFLYANAAKMYAAMYPAGAAKAVWVVHPSVLPLLIAQQNVVKNVAGTENVGGATAISMNSDGQITLLGRPVLVSEHCSSIGDLGDIVFIDFSQLAVFIRKDMSVETSNSVYWTSDEIAYRLLMRATAMGLWEGKGVRPNSGGNDSWAVMLAAR